MPPYLTSLIGGGGVIIQTDKSYHFLFSMTLSSYFTGSFLRVALQFFEQNRNVVIMHFAEYDEKIVFSEVP